MNATGQRESQRIERPLCPTKPWGGPPDCVPVDCDADYWAMHLRGLADLTRELDPDKAAEYERWAMHVETEHADEKRMTAKGISLSEPTPSPCASSNPMDLDRF